MPKYVLAYHGGSTPEDPAKQEEVMAAWGTWFESIGADMVDPGNAISHAKTVASDGSVSDGGGASPLTGYSIINAPTIEAATDHAKACPVNLGGGSVEVAATVDM